MTFEQINAGHRAFARAIPAVTVKAWRVSPDNPHHEAEEVALPDRFDQHSAAHIAATRAKDMVLVLVTDAAARPERRNVLATYIVRQKAARLVNRNGQTVREAPLYPDLIGVVCVADGFLPIRPFNAFLDNPVGNDITLVEASR